MELPARDFHPGGAPNNEKMPLLVARSSAVVRLCAVSGNRANADDPGMPAAPKGDRREAGSSALN